MDVKERRKSHVTFKEKELDLHSKSPEHIETCGTKPEAKSKVTVTLPAEEESESVLQSSSRLSTRELDVKERQNSHIMFKK